MYKILNMGCGQSDKMFLIILAVFFMLVMVSNTDNLTGSINERMTNVSLDSNVEKIDLSKTPELIKKSEIKRVEDQYSGKYCPNQPFIGKNRGYINWEQIY